MSGVTLTHRIDDRALRKVLERLERMGRGVVFAGAGWPAFTVVIREGPGIVVIGLEVDTVEIQDEPTTVTA